MPCLATIASRRVTLLYFRTRSYPHRGFLQVSRWRFSHWQNDASEGGLQGVAPLGRVATARDLVCGSRSAPRVRKEIWRSRLISAERAGFISPSGLCRSRGIPSGPRSLWMSKKYPGTPAPSIGGNGRAPGATAKKSYANASELGFQKHLAACARKDRLIKC